MATRYREDILYKRRKHVAAWVAQAPAYWIHAKRRAPVPRPVRDYRPHRKPKQSAAFDPQAPAYWIHAKKRKPAPEAVRDYRPRRPKHRIPLLPAAPVAVFLPRPRRRKVQFPAHWTWRRTHPKLISNQAFNVAHSSLILTPKNTAGPVTATLGHAALTLTPSNVTINTALATTAAALTLAAKNVFGAVSATLSKAALTLNGDNVFANLAATLTKAALTLNGDNVTIPSQPESFTVLQAALSLLGKLVSLAGVIMAAIVRLHPVARQAGMVMPEIVTAAQWVDNLVLVASTSQSYTVPSDASGNRGTILRIKISTGPVYLNPFGSTATVPASNVTSGTGQITMINTEHVWLELPPASVISFISAGTPVISIEVWN